LRWSGKAVTLKTAPGERQEHHGGDLGAAQGVVLSCFPGAAGQPSLRQSGRAFRKVAGGIKAAGMTARADGR